MCRISIIIGEDDEFRSYGKMCLMELPAGSNYIDLYSIELCIENIGRNLNKETLLCSNIFHTRKE